MKQTLSFQSAFGYDVYPSIRKQSRTFSLQHHLSTFPQTLPSLTPVLCRHMEQFAEVQTQNTGYWFKNKSSQPTGFVHECLCDLMQTMLPYHWGPIIDTSVPPQYCSTTIGNSWYLPTLCSHYILCAPLLDMSLFTLIINSFLYSSNSPRVH